MSNNCAEDFENLLALIGRFGGYRPPTKMSYGLAVIINRMGGWIRVCQWTYREAERQRMAFRTIRRDVERLLSSPAAGTLGPVTITGMHENVLIYP